MGGPAPSDSRLTLRRIRPRPAPSFQPLLLAFDPAQDRLFAAAAGEDRRGVRLFVFPQPGKQGARPGASLDLAGMISGLSYDSDAKTLFVADAAGHALLIFDRFDPRSTMRASRVLKRFNFPTGVYADRSRLFVADAHPGALLVFEKAAEIDGERRPDRTIGPEQSGLNGPFAIAADPDRGRLYVSNFDGVLAFNLADLSAPPDRLPLPAERWRAAWRSTPNQSASTSPRRWSDLISSTRVSGWSR